MSEPIPCLIRTLAPVHLGADEVYEPLGFVIDETKTRLVAFEPGDFLARLTAADRRRFLEICKKGTVDSLLEIYRFYHERRRLAQGRVVAVCPGLVEHYRQVVNTRADVKDLQKTINQFTIHRTAFLPHDQRPYLPGAAVKGALRTAYLNALAQLKPLPTPRDQRGRWDPRALEQRLLDYRHIDEDPFRLLKVSDFLPVGEVKTRIVYAVNEKKKTSQFAARGPYQILEVIEPGAEFVGTIGVEDLPQELRRLARIKHFFTLKELWQAAQKFYQGEKRREDGHLFELGLKADLLTAGNGATPLRLGRHSGAECVTIAGHRKIKIKKTGSDFDIKDHATTLWLAADFHQRNQRHKANLRPFGWVALRELTSEEAAAFKEQEAAWRQRPKATRNACAQTGPHTSEPETAAPVSTPHTQPTSVIQEIWKEAFLTYEKGKQLLIATWQGKKAWEKGLDLVSPDLKEKLAGKKTKAIKARVTVEPEGIGFRIRAVEPL